MTPAETRTTRILMVTIPEWGHLSPFLHLAKAIKRQWDGSRGHLQLCLASMEQVRTKVEAHGIDFVSIGTWDGSEAEEYARGSRASFDPSASLIEKMQHGAASLMSMLGLKMGAALMNYLEDAKQSGTLPDVIVNDGLTSAGFDAAEKMQLPLAVIWPFPLTMCLMLAGYPNYCLPANVPLEFLNFNTAEDAHPFIRHGINPITKRLVTALCNASFGGSRRRVRQQLGLPAAMAPPSLRNPDGTSTGMFNGWRGPLAVQPAVPRTIYLAGVTWEMNAMRELPPCWHMVGPLVVDRQDEKNFPPQFGPEDTAVEAFLQAAADAGEPVVFTAAGSMTHLSQQQVGALLNTFNTLTSSSSGNTPVRVLWALREGSQQLLPAHLRSSSSSTTASATPTGNAAAADVAAAASLNNRLLVVSWVKQTAVLAHPATKVFISHGGLGSVHECLALGQAVPLVVPFSNGADHVTIGQQLVNRKLGVLLTSSQMEAPGQLLAAVRELLGDEGYSRRVGEVAQAWQKAGCGPKMAAEKLLGFAAACKQQK